MPTEEEGELPIDAPREIKRILVPVDLNRLSEAKIPYAEAQARAFDAELTLLHVIPASPAPDGAPTITESQARSYLDALTARLRGDGISVDTLVRFGPVVDVVLDEVTALNADLLVIGSNVRRGISRLLLGSVAEELVARAQCPVLLIRPNVEEAEKTMPVRSFADDIARAGPVAPRHLGIRTVDVDRIVGSVGRAGELDSSFRIPSRRKIELQRYAGILKAMDSGEPIPPVVLYKLGYGYYVLDGNHRVAAARELKMAEIEADVTEFVPLADTQVQRVFAERRAFERTTGLTRVGAAQPGNYNRIEDMIRAFAVDHPELDFRDAAQLWQERVYLPATKAIRSRRLGERMPGHRTADVLVEVAYLKDQLSTQRESAVSWEDAASALYERLTPSATTPTESVASSPPVAADSAG